MADNKSPKRFVMLVRWVFESFGPLLIFVVLEHTVSLLAAIISSIVTGVVLVALQIARESSRTPEQSEGSVAKRSRASPFTVFVAISVAVFGVLDLKYRTGFFVKLEPALGNTVTGLFFLGTVLLGRPVIAELAQKQRAEPLSDNALRYLRALTIAWGVFFFMRAAGYVWMAYHLTLDQALAIRSVLGPVSFGVMIFGEMGIRFVRFGKRGFQRGAQTIAASASPKLSDAQPLARPSS